MLVEEKDEKIDVEREEIGFISEVVGMLLF